MSDILLNHWVLPVFLGWILVVIFGNVLTRKNGGSVRRQVQVPPEPPRPAAHFEAQQLTQAEGSPAAEPGDREQRVRDLGSWSSSRGERTSASAARSDTVS